MLKKYSIMCLSVALCFSACSSSKSEPTKNLPAKDTNQVAPITTASTKPIDRNDPNLLKMVFRSDGFRPGVASEWIQVAYAESGGTILAIWHWDTNNEQPKELKIVNQSYTSGEISAVTGRLIYGADTDTSDFTQIENSFRLFISDDQMQEFDQE